jgi:hypothetical protein
MQKDSKNVSETKETSQTVNFTSKVEELAQKNDHLGAVASLFV